MSELSVFFLLSGLFFGFFVRFYYDISKGSSKQPLISKFTILCACLAAMIQSFVLTLLVMAWWPWTSIFPALILVAVVLSLFWFSLRITTKKIVSPELVSHE